MAGFTEYLIDDTLPADVYRHFDCNYVLDGGVLLQAEQMNAWCYSCANTIAAELVPSLEELDTRIRDLDNPENLILKLFGRAALNRDRKNLPIRRRWRESRQSGARCLECGSTGICAIIGNNFTEPRFQKRIRMTSGGFASMRFDIVRRLSPEGVVIYSDDPAKTRESK